MPIKKVTVEFTIDVPRGLDIDLVRDALDEAIDVSTLYIQDPDKDDKEYEVEVDSWVVQQP